MTNEQVFRAFADGRPAHANSVSSVVTDHATILYSYSTPVAFIKHGMDAAYIDGRKYSPTTSKQVSQAMYAVGAHHVMSHDEFRDVVGKFGADLSLAR